MPDQLGAFADAARAREQQLVQRLATSAELDRSVETILRGAHQYNLQSRARLDALDAEIRQSAASWPGLDTPAGARQFQAYLAGKTREIRRVVADAGADSRRRAEQAQALTGRYPRGGGSQILKGEKRSPTNPPTPDDPPSYDPADTAELLQKIDEWRRKNLAVTAKIEAFNNKWPNGTVLNIEDPNSTARFQEWKREHDAVQVARNEIVKEYGEIIVEAAKFGGQPDGSTGDIVWPDGARVSLRSDG